MARGEVIAVGIFLLFIAIIAYNYPLFFTVGGQTASNTVPNVVAFCESGIGQFAQLSPEVVRLCSEFNNYRLGIYAAGIIGIIMIIVGAILPKTKKELIYDANTGKTEYRNSEKEDDPLNILKKRYAQGEITKEEFEDKKKDLENF